MSYRVVVKSSAERDFERLSGNLKPRVAEALRGLPDDPRPHTSKALSGVLRDLRSLRVGDWRIVYHVDDAELLVEVTEIAHRSKVYQRAERKVSD